MDREMIDRIVGLREKGMGYRAIALETGVKRDLVRYYCKLRGLGGEITETLKDKGCSAPSAGKPSSNRRGADAGSDSVLKHADVLSGTHIRMRHIRMRLRSIT